MTNRFADFEIPDDWRPSVDPKVLWRHVEDSIVLVHLGTDKIYELSRTSGRLWELLNGGMPFAGALQELQHEFDVAEELVEAEARDFVGMLVEERLVDDPRSR